LTQSIFVSSVKNKSLKLLVILYNLIKLRKFKLLILSELFHDERLGIDTVAHLFLELFDRCFHPMFIIKGRLYFLVPELYFYLVPDFSDFEVWVHLDYLHLLLLMGVEIVLVEANTVKDTEYYEANVILLDLLSDPVD
jgi:hypothetical protein